MQRPIGNSKACTIFTASIKALVSEIVRCTKFFGKAHTKTDPVRIYIGVVKISKRKFAVSRTITCFIGAHVVIFS